MALSPSGPWRAVLFDLDDTLVPWQTIAHWQWAWHPRGPVLSVRHTQAALKRSLHAWDRRRWDGLVGKTPPTDDASLRQSLRDTLAAVAGRSLPPPEVEAVVDRFLKPAGEIEQFADVGPCLAALRAAQISLGVVTELPAEVARAALRRAGIPDTMLVRAGDDSDGLRFPTAGAFRSATARVGLKPKETFFVGDLYWSDVRAAARAGLGAVLLDRRDWSARVEAPRLHSLTELGAYLANPPAPTGVGESAGTSTGNLD